MNALGLKSSAGRDGCVRRDRCVEVGLGLILLRFPRCRRGRLHSIRPHLLALKCWLGVSLSEGALMISKAAGLGLTMTVAIR